MQTYDFTLAASSNASRQIDAVGNYLYYYAGSAGGADTTIKLRGLSTGLQVQLKPGQSFRCEPGKVETSWVLVNYAGAGIITGFVTIGLGQIQDNRITGEVSIIDGGSARTRAGKAFSSNIFCAAVAAQYAHCQLWNQSTTVNMMVEQLIAFSTAAVGVTIRGHNAQLSTPSGSANPQSKYIGGAASANQNRIQNAVAAIPVGATIGSLLMAANAMAIYKLTEPILIQPSQGLVLYVNNAFNTDLSVVAELFEEPL